MSKELSSKIAESGVVFATCRHGMLLKGLNMYKGERYAYAHFLQVALPLLEWQQLSVRFNIIY